MSSQPSLSDKLQAFDRSCLKQWSDDPEEWTPWFVLRSPYAYINMHVSLYMHAFAQHTHLYTHTEKNVGTLLEKPKE